MKIFTIICALVGLVGTIFGSWGRYSEAGQKKFDEMAGMIPFFSQCIGIFLLVLAACGLYLASKNN
ncbi:MAG: hypothetical protein NE327_00670 [Lentisphaeraceae bacterium]|nr:hypothetical protein [Lentisphaeraceae bacterium]